MPTRPVGTLFRDIVIDHDLRQLVNVILQAPSSADPSVVAAKKGIRAMAMPNRAYLFASEIRAYLEEKTRVGTEPWAFPVAGDLFLDALEGDLSLLGPNLFRDHYSGMAGCYRAGDCPVKAIQGAFFCVDVVLRKVIDLFLTKDNVGRSQETISLSFHVSEESDYRKVASHFLDLGRQCLQDAVDAAIRMAGSDVSPAFRDFVVDRKSLLQTVLDRWEAHHRNPVLSDLTNAQYLENVASAAEETGYAPLVATIEECQVHLREQEGLMPNGKTELELEIHPLYNAAATYLTEGNKDRDATAYDLAFRRYNKAVALFTKIQDRTSAAKVFVEMARAFIQSGDDPESIRAGLHKAVCLVIAHIKNLPQDTFPDVTHDEAIRFLKAKGYAIEARAYASTLDAIVSPESA